MALEATDSNSKLAAKLSDAGALVEAKTLNNTAADAITPKAMLQTCKVSLEDIDAKETVATNQPDSLVESLAPLASEQQQHDSPMASKTEDDAALVSDAVLYTKDSFKQTNTVVTETKEELVESSSMSDGQPATATWKNLCR